MPVTFLFLLVCLLSPPFRLSPSRISLIARSDDLQVYSTNRRETPSLSSRSHQLDCASAIAAIAAVAIDPQSDQQNLRNIISNPNELRDTIGWPLDFAHDPGGNDKLSILYCQICHFIVSFLFISMSPPPPCKKKQLALE